MVLPCIDMRIYYGENGTFSDNLENRTKEIHFLTKKLVKSVEIFSEICYYKIIHKNAMGAFCDVDGEEWEERCDTIMYCMICKENNAGGDGLCVKCRFRMSMQNKEGAADTEILLPEGRYVGKAKNGIPNGKGEITYNEHDSRRSYKGDFKEGMRHGKGKLIFRNDAYYDGDWLNDKYDGYGEESLPGGNVLEGYYTAGHLTSGHVYFGDGREYDGEWNDDMPNGMGKMFFHDGHAEEGYWVNGICAFPEKPSEEQIAQFLADQEQRALNENPLEDEQDSVRIQQNTSNLPQEDFSDRIWNPLAREKLAAMEEDEGAPLLFDGMQQSDNVTQVSGNRAEPVSIKASRPVFRGNGIGGSDIEFDLEDEADAVAKRVAEATAKTLVVIDDSVSEVDLNSQESASDNTPGQSTEAAVPQNNTSMNREGTKEMIESSFIDPSEEKKETANNWILQGMYENIGKPIPEEEREKVVVKPVVTEKALEDNAMQKFFAKMGVSQAETADEAPKAETVAAAAEAVPAAAEETAPQEETKAAEPDRSYDPVTKTGYRAETYANGERYEGYFVNGKRCGIGRMEYHNGDVYEGHYTDGKRDGQGIMKYANGSVYEGNWENSVKSGQGKFTMANGENYQGNFENGTFGGFGTYSFANGNIYMGDWKAGRREGKGVLVYADGKKEAQIWENGKKILAEIVLEEPKPAAAPEEASGNITEQAEAVVETTAAENTANEAPVETVASAEQTTENTAVEAAVAAEPEKAAEAEAEPEKAAEAVAEPEKAAEAAAETEKAAEPAAEPEKVAEAVAEPEKAAEPAAEPEVTEEPVREVKSINYKSGNRYQGEVDEKSLPHGKGVFTYSNGSYYDGAFEHGIRSGYGVFTWSTGDRYEGEWKNDKRHGQGKMKYANGRVREGRFENNDYVAF